MSEAKVDKNKTFKLMKSAGSNKWPDVEEICWVLQRTTKLVRSLAGQHGLNYSYSSFNAE